jgi:outer membrane protein
MRHMKGVVGMILGLALIIGGVVIAQPTAAQAQNIKIGIINLQRAIEQSKQGQVALAKLKSKYEKLNTDLKRRESEIEKLQKDLEALATSSVIKPERRTEMERDLRRKTMDFQDIFRDSQEEMKREQMEVTKPVYEGVLRTTQKLGKDKGFTVIFEGAVGIVYAPEALDITDEVIRLFDSGQ